MVYQGHLIGLEMGGILNALELAGVEVFGSHSGSPFGIDAAHSFAFNGGHPELILC